MRGLISASFLIFRAQLWRTLRSKRTLVCAALACLPVLLALVLSLYAQNSPTDDFRFRASQQIAWNFIIQGLVPILSLIAGAAVISEEIEDRTITYLLTSPVPRSSILFGRWLAAFIWLALLVSLSQVGILCLLDMPERMDSGGELPIRLYSTLIGISVLGCGVYSAGFAALGARLKRPMIVGLVYTFAIEVLLSNLPGKARVVAVQHYLRSIAAEWSGSYVKTIEGFPEAGFDSGETALLKLALALTVALGLGAWTLSKRQYVMSS